ncbi:uncharacterized protein LOC132277360 [Cornus florida]|uniref:uncharacterized protein LOC132277360 n=1 Tax=Cornus florida TaxID=4283 RepID=UPI00289E44EB|nr:uncharacterized protein LOC132277360 [Cornus florida]
MAATADSVPATADSQQRCSGSSPSFGATTAIDTSGSAVQIRRWLWTVKKIRRRLWTVQWFGSGEQWFGSIVVVYGQQQADLQIVGRSPAALSFRDDFSQHYNK